MSGVWNQTTLVVPRWFPGMEHCDRCVLVFFLESWEQPVILDCNKGWLFCLSQAAAFKVLFFFSFKEKSHSDICHPEYGKEARLRLILKFASKRINWEWDEFVCMWVRVGKEC